MPIYEYRCGHCGHHLERLQRLRDEPLRHCPSCGHASLNRLVSAAGFRLKGGGWYETDFKQGQKRNLADSGKEKSTESKTDAGESGKQADAKPAPAGKSNDASAGN